MKRSTNLLLLCFLLFTSFRAVSQGLTATTSTTAATCPANGSITVTASGGAGGYLYSITSGPVIKPEQPSNTFTDLPPGAYSLRVKDNNNATFDVNATIANRYVDMQPTASATNEICFGSNTGSIRLSMPAGQGTAPYTYTIESGPV